MNGAARRGAPGRRSVLVAAATLLDGAPARRPGRAGRPPLGGYQGSGRRLRAARLLQPRGPAADRRRRSTSASPTPSPRSPAARPPSPGPRSPTPATCSPTPTRCWPWSAPDYPAGTFPPYPFRVTATSGVGEPTAESNPAPGLERPRRGRRRRARTAQATPPAVDARRSPRSARCRPTATTATDGVDGHRPRPTEISGFNLLGVLTIDSIVTDLTATSDGRRHRADRRHHRHRRHGRRPARHDRRRRHPPARGTPLRSSAACSAGSPARRTTSSPGRDQRHARRPGGARAAARAGQLAAAGLASTSSSRSGPFPASPPCSTRPADRQPDPRGAEHRGPPRHRRGPAPRLRSRSAAASCRSPPGRASRPARHADRRGRPTPSLRRCRRPSPTFDLPAVVGRPSPTTGGRRPVGAERVHTDPGRRRRRRAGAARAARASRSSATGSARLSPSPSSPATAPSPARGRNDDHTRPVRGPRRAAPPSRTRDARLDRRRRTSSPTSGRRSIARPPRRSCSRVAAALMALGVAGDPARLGRRRPRRRWSRSRCPYLISGGLLGVALAIDRRAHALQPLAHRRRSARPGPTRPPGGMTTPSSSRRCELAGRAPSPTERRSRNGRARSTKT